MRDNPVTSAAPIVRAPLGDRGNQADNRPWISNLGEEGRMNTAICRTVTVACFALFAALAQAQAPAALTGQVSSAEEGAMEGVVVSAKRDGSTISVSVVTDAQGRFVFPAARLEPGRYTLRARAAGFEIDGAKAADVAGSEARTDIKLRKVKNLSAHLTNAEWMSS